LRLADTTLADTQWIESVATLVAKMAPERWGDKDESVFFEHLSYHVPRFKRIESMAFKGVALNAEKFSRSIRLTVTRPDGTEADEVFHWGPDEDHRFENAEQALHNLMRSHGKIALAAAAHLFWQQQAIQKKDS
jgi:hypothetical protein